MSRETKEAPKSTKSAPRGNGDGDAAENRSGSTIADRDPHADTGDRETKNPGEQDKIWTNESKEVWGEDQPTLAELLKNSDESSKKAAEAEDKKSK